MADFALPHDHGRHKHDEALHRELMNTERFSAVADVFKQPIYIPACEESGCLGSAIMAALGLGVYDTLEQAVANMVKNQRVVFPDQEKSLVYDNMYRLYTTLYETLSTSGYFQMHGVLTRENGRMTACGNGTSQTGLLP